MFLLLLFYWGWGGGYILCSLWTVFPGGGGRLSCFFEDCHSTHPEERTLPVDPVLSVLSVVDVGGVSVCSCVIFILPDCSYFPFRL